MMNRFYQTGRMVFGLGVSQALSKSSMAILLSMFFSISVLAQDLTVTGRVSDKSGSGLPGVTVQVKGTSKGAQTDLDGKYSVSGVPSKGTLSFSFVGMTSQEVAVGGRSSINVTMADDAALLNEVVVVGYGTQKRNEISGTVSSVSSKEFNVGQVTTPLQAIAGKVAGLAISQSGSDPNGQPTVRLRGVGSLTANSSPLYVVDGVFVDDISVIAPQDIESVDVLRDASSSAIYGSRGADGVIIVTTKRGKEGKTSASYSGYVGTESISSKPSYANAAQFRAATKISAAADKGADTDWTTAMTRGTAVTHNHDVSFTGGSKGFGYRASIGYLNQQGILKKSSRERTTASFNIDQTALNDKLKVAYSLFYGITDRNVLDRSGHVNPALGDGSRVFGLTPYFALGMIANMFPTDPITNPDGTWYEDKDAFSKFNPVAILMESTDIKKSNDYRGAINARYTLAEGLTFGVNAGATGTTDVNSYYISRNTKQTSGIGGAGGKMNANTISKLLETTLNYDKAVRTNDRLGLLAGYGYQDITRDGFFAQNSGFITDLLSNNNLGAGNTIPSGGTVTINGSEGGFITDGVGSYKNNEKLVSFFGRAQYSLNNTFFFTGNIRRDGSTKFGANHKWGLFPSASVGVSLSELGFLKGNKTIDNLKLRVNWGQTGQSNGIRPYQTLSLVGPSGFYYNSGNWLPQYVSQQNENPDLKWQVNTSYGAGIDFSLLKTRLMGSLDYYVKNTSDLLYNATVSGNWTDSKGVIRNFVTGNMLTNIGSLSNKGVELTLNGLIINKKDFSWNAIVAASSNANKVTSLSSANFEVPNPTFIPTSLGDYVKGTSRVNFSALQVGHPVGQFYGAQVLNINDKGSFDIKDINGDGKLDPDGLDRTFIGSAQPKILLSITNNFSYKNWSASFLLNGRYGNKIMNGVRTLLANGGYPAGLDGNFLEEATTTALKSPVTGSYDYYVENGGFMRLQNANIAYKIPSKVGPLSNVSLYVSGNNLFVITKYKGVDPELNLDGLNPGVDTRKNYFKTRGFQFGVNASF
jgi:TonB-dependent starch-binding outer membrane protein SusC